MGIVALTDEADGKIIFRCANGIAIFQLFHQDIGGVEQSLLDAGMELVFSGLAEQGSALSDDRIGDVVLPGKPSGGGVGTLGVGEYVKEAQSAFLHHGQGVGEGHFGFGGKSGDEVGPQGDIGVDAAQLVDAFEYVTALAVASHALADQIIAALDGQVEMGAEGGAGGEQFQQFIV
ncbi:MAG: hypothetical protein HW380_3037 [Magnetococcales bacterium]|nr:hypothetical protein [Magnetococcales bacterium]